MTLGEQVQISMRPGGPRPTVQDLLDLERVPVPWPFRAASTVDMGTSDISKERYVSPEFHRLEVEAVWGKVWQMACREEDLMAVGDTVVYDIAHWSVLVVRVSEAEIKAYHNVCLHRGSQLREYDGNVPELRCTFHGFCWNLDGTLKEIPCEWDFEHVDRAKFCLPEVRLDTWEGFVFVNFDEQAPPLREYLGGMIEHFEAIAGPRLRDRHKGVHIAKVFRCNWKVALEAFLESFHVLTTHPQLLPYLGDANTQYDVYPGEPHWNRMITPGGVASPHLGPDVDEQDIADAMERDHLLQPTATGGTEAVVPEGSTARALAADRNREFLSQLAGLDVSSLPDCETVDGIEYFVFPNFMPWMGIGVPLAYRFRPYGNDPDMSIMDLMLLFPLHPMIERPATLPAHLLGPDDDWNSAPGLGSFAWALNQDTSNLQRLQKGLHAMTKPGITLGSYQESRIRHFHQVLDDYIARVGGEH